MIFHYRRLPYFEKEFKASNTWNCPRAILLDDRMPMTTLDQLRWRNVCLTDVDSHVVSWTFFEVSVAKYSFPIFEAVYGSPAVAHELTLRQKEVPPEWILAAGFMAWWNGKPEIAIKAHLLERVHYGGRSINPCTFTVQVKVGFDSNLRVKLPSGTSYCLAIHAISEAMKRLREEEIFPPRPAGLCATDMLKNCQGCRHRAICDTADEHPNISTEELCKIL